MYFGSQANSECTIEPIVIKGRRVLMNTQICDEFNRNCFAGGHKLIALRLIMSLSGTCSTFLN